MAAVCRKTTPATFLCQTAGAESSNLPETRMPIGPAAIGMEIVN